MRNLEISQYLDCPARAPKSRPLSLHGVGAKGTRSRTFYTIFLTTSSDRIPLMKFPYILLGRHTSPIVPYNLYCGHFTEEPVHFTEGPYIVLSNPIDVSTVSICVTLSVDFSVAPGIESVHLLWAHTNLYGATAWWKIVLTCVRVRMCCTCGSKGGRVYLPARLRDNRGISSILNLICAPVGNTHIALEQTPH